MDADGESVIKGRTGEWRNNRGGTVDRRYNRKPAVWAYYPFGRYIRAGSMYYNDATKLWHLRLLHWEEHGPTHFCDPHSPPFGYVEDIINLSMEHIYADYT